MRIIKSCVSKGTLNFLLIQMNTFFSLSLFLPLREKVSHTLFIWGFYFVFLYIFVYFHLNGESSMLKRKLNIKRLPLFGWIQAEKEVIMHKCKRYGQREDETSKWSESDKAEVIFRRGLQTELHEWEHVSADKVFFVFLLSRSNTYRTCENLQLAAFSL